MTWLRTKAVKLAATNRRESGSAVSRGESVKNACTRRVDYLDHLRVFLVALVICHHLAIAFGAPGGWYYILAGPPDIPSFIILTMFVAVNQAFFMSLLFFIAGYFTSASLDRKGPRQFIRERVVRLGIPLMVYYLFLNPSIIYIVRLWKGTVPPGYFRFMADQGPGHFGWGPLWFVLALLVFSAGYLVWVAWRHYGGRRAHPLPCPTNGQIIAFISGVGGFTFLLRMVVPLGTGLLGLEIAYFPLYVAFFVFGIQAFRADWLNRLDARRASPWFRAALALIVALPVLLVLGGALRGEEAAFRGGVTWQSMAYCLWEPVLCVGISMKLLVVFRARFNAASRTGRILSRSAYASYIIHPFYVVIATKLAMNWPLPAIVTVAVLTAPLLAVCFFSANLLRQVPLLKTVL